MQDAWLTVVITKNIKTKKLSNIEQLDYIISPYKIKIKNKNQEKIFDLSARIPIMRIYLLYSLWFHNGKKTKPFKKQDLDLC